MNFEAKFLTPDRMHAAVNIGRGALAIPAGIAVTGGLFYVGCKIGTDVVGPANAASDPSSLPGKALEYAAIATPPFVLGGIIGTPLGFYTTTALWGK